MNANVAKKKSVDGVISLAVIALSHPELMAQLLLTHLLLMHLQHV